MKLRTILYGYTFQNAGYIPDSSESNVVQSIYSEYIGGTTIAEIAKRLNAADVPYSPDKSTWDKNIIYRILTDARYIGEGIYPQIISKELFERANQKENIAMQEPITDELQWLKQKAFCHACGKQLYRRRMKDGSYRWICLNKCIRCKPIRDKNLQDMILMKLSQLKEHPEDASESSKNAVFSLSPEARKYENEIERLISEPKPSYQLVKSVVLDCVSKRYDCCVNSGTDDISKEFTVALSKEPPGFDLMKKLCEKIAVDEKGEVHLILKNGKDCI
ncbi:MAG: recombinase family protein [Clostridiales bacterium]|nr:recombinase family protein [Clostridiales bacterium]